MTATDTLHADAIDPQVRSNGVAPSIPSSARPALELRGVVKEFPGQPPVRALDDVSLRIDHGELVAVVGPSGSGKSTLLNVMGTLDRPTSGVVAVEGTDTAELSDNEVAGVRASKIGFVFQQFFLLPGMSAVDNVANGLLYQGVAPRERRRRSIEALERVGLGHRLDHDTKFLSGGERQRVAVARALVHRPAFVLADEPTGNLDSRSTDAVMRLLGDLHDEGATIVVITHDTAIAAALPRQVAVFDGRITTDGIGDPAPTPAPTPTSASAPTPTSATEATPEGDPSC